MISEGGTISLRRSWKWARRANVFSSATVVAAMLAVTLIGGLGLSAPSVAAGDDGPMAAGLPGSGWIPDMTVVSNTASDARPSLTTDALGDVLMAYESYEAGNADVYFARSSDAGVTWSVSIGVATTATDEVHPDITTDPFSGRIFITYQLGTSGATSILVAYSDDNGGTWTTRTAFTCGVFCERPRIASEYWNGASNRQYVVFAGEITASTDWNWAIVRSTDGGDSWAALYESGLSITDVRHQPEIAVQRGPDAVDRVIVFFRQGGTFPGTNLRHEWSEDYGASWTQGAWGVNVNSPISVAAAQDGSSLMVAYSTVSPADNIVWAIDRDVTNLGTFTTWNWWINRGYWPDLTVDGQGTTDTTIGGNYHLIAHDVAGFRVLYMRAPVTMTSQASWTPVAVITDEGADASDTYREKGLTVHVRSGTWYAVAGWADLRDSLTSADDVWVTTPGSRWTIDSSPSSGVQIDVDGVGRTTPYVASFPAGTTHTVSVASPVTGPPGTRFAWLSWSDGGAQTHTITAGTTDTTLTATFSMEVLLTLVSAPGGVTGAGWYALGESAFITALSPVDAGNGTRYAFTHWAGDASGISLAVLITMDAPKTIVANWKTQYLVTVISAHGSVAGAGWYDEGTTATLTLESNDVAEDGKEWLFTGWSGGPTGTAPSVDVAVDGPVTVTANWREKGLFETSTGTLLILLIALLAAILLILALFLRKRRSAKAVYPPNAWQVGPTSSPVQPPAESPTTPPSEPSTEPPGPQ